MTKNRIIGAIAALSLLAVPAVAVAHSSGDDHGHHHGRHHHKHQARDVTGAATGTIASFTNGELTITLPNGKSFAADVKRRTVILCKSTPVVPMAAKVARHGNDDGNSGPGRSGRDDGNDAGDDNATSTTLASTATPPSTTVPAPTMGDDHGHDHNDGHGARCGTDALVAGAQVSDAKLSLKGGTATWKKVVVLK